MSDSTSDGEDDGPFVDVGVSAGTIDGGDDGEAFDSDGITERSKNDGKLDVDNSVGLGDDNLGCRSSK